MADSKVTDLTAATSVNSADVLYLVQNSLDRKLSISTLLANLPATLAKFSGLVALTGNKQTINNTGVINATDPVTFITNTADAVLNIANGSYDGQLKFIIMTYGIHASTLSSVLLGPAITFNAVGDSATLMWLSTQNKWCAIGGTASGAAGPNTEYGNIDGGGA